MNSSAQKYWRFAFILIPLVVLALLFGSYFYISHVAREQLHEELTQILGTHVDVGPVSLSPVSGTGTVGGLYIRNPENFDRNYALLAKHLRVQVNSSNKGFVIERVYLNGPRINWVVNDNHSNFDQLQSFTEQNAGGPKLRLRQLQIDNAELQIFSPALGNEPILISLPRIQLAEVEGSASEVAARVLKVFNEQVEAAMLESSELKRALLEKRSK